MHPLRSNHPLASILTLNYYSKQHANLMMVIQKIFYLHMVLDLYPLLTALPKQLLVTILLPKKKAEHPLILAKTIMNVVIMDMM